MEVLKNGSHAGFVLSEPGHVFIRALKNFLEVEETPFISRLNKNSNDKAGKE